MGNGLLRADHKLLICNPACVIHLVAYCGVHGLVSLEMWVKKKKKKKTLHQIILVFELINIKFNTLLTIHY